MCNFITDEAINIGYALIFSSYSYKLVSEASKKLLHKINSQDRDNGQLSLCSFSSYIILSAVWDKLISAHSFCTNITSSKVPIATSQTCYIRMTILTITQLSG